MMVMMYDSYNHGNDYDTLVVMKDHRDGFDLLHDNHDDHDQRWYPYLVNNIWPIFIPAPHTKTNPGKLNLRDNG